MKHTFLKSLSLCFLILLSFMSSLTVADVSAATYSLTDCMNDTAYSVTISNSRVSITSGNTSSVFHIDTPILGCSVYGGVFSFLSYKEKSAGNYTAVIASCDINSGVTEFVDTNLPVSATENRFAVDRYSNIYLPDSRDDSLIHCYTADKTEYTADCKNSVRQILCIDGENVTVITVNGAYLLKGAIAIRISDMSPAVPCTYKGGGIVTDADGVEYNIESGVMSPVVSDSAEGTEGNDDKKSSNSITSEINGEFICADAGTTVAKLYKELGVNKSDLRVQKEDGTDVSSGKLGTGMTASFLGKTYRVVIQGDLTGEGSINSRDLKMMMKYLTGEVMPDEIHRLSADINNDGTLNTKDLLLLSRMY